MSFVVFGGWVASLKSPKWSIITPTTICRRKTMKTFSQMYHNQWGGVSIILRGLIVQQLYFVAIDDLIE